VIVKSTPSPVNGISVGEPAALCVIVKFAFLTDNEVGAKATLT